MKRALTLLVILLLCVCCAAAFAADPETNVFTDDVSGVRFTIPEGWSRASFTQEKASVFVMFSADDEPEPAIVYAGADLWSRLTLSQKLRLPRKNFGMSKLTVEQFAEMEDVSAESVERVLYGNYDYFRYTMRYGEDADPALCVIRVANGYSCAFYFTGAKTDARYGDFEKMLRSAVYPADMADARGVADAGRTSWVGRGWGGLLVDLLLTIALYSLPPVVYRFAIRKRPMNRKSALLLAVIYALAASTALLALTQSLGRAAVPGAAIFFWSYVNYMILRAGSASDGTV